MRPYRSAGPVAGFLYIHGPDVSACVMLALCLAACVADYALQPDGFMRFAVLLVKAALS